MTLDRKQKVIIGFMVAIVAAIVLLYLQGCTQNMNLTPQAQYYSALKTFNDNVEVYLENYRAATPETQAKWKKTIDPLILAANQALQTWRLSLGSPSAASKEQAWLDAQKKFTTMLISSGIIKVEGR